MSAEASFFWCWYAANLAGSFRWNLSRLFLAAPVPVDCGGPGCGAEGGAGAGGAAKDEVAPEIGARGRVPDSELEVALAKASLQRRSTSSASLVDVAG